MTTVLYVHGLEAGPRGRKSAMLEQAGFHVVSEQMPCGRGEVARDPLVWGLVASAAIAVAASTQVAGRRGLGVSLGLLALAAPAIPSLLMRRVFERSLAVQRRALAANQIDAVVGSSFGGAVALELVLRGAWSGPTLLLCPAHELVAHRARRRPPRGLASLPDAVAERVLVVHGRADATVPPEHSQRLVEGSRASLVRVDDDHRLTASSTAEGLASWLERLGVVAAG